MSCKWRKEDDDLRQSSLANDDNRGNEGKEKRSAKGQRKRDSLSMDFWCPSAWAYHRDRIGCLRASSTSSMQWHGYFHVMQHACNDCKFHSPVDPTTRLLCIDRPHKTILSWEFVATNSKRKKPRFSIHYRLPIGTREEDEMFLVDINSSILE